MDNEQDKIGLIAPLLYRWDDVVLSFSATSQLAPHSHGAAELIVALKEPVCVALENHQVTASSVLIPPGVIHQNTYRDPVSAVIYLDIESFRYRELANLMTEEQATYVNVPYEQELQKTLADVYRREPSLEECYFIIFDELLNASKGSAKDSDARVVSVAKTIKENPTRDVPIKELAEQVNLSEDRLHHLFTAELGLPIHKYRIWLRLKNASRLYFDGHTLTFAAHESGFSDAAHFSRTFSRMFGAAPSNLLTQDRRRRAHFS